VRKHFTFWKILAASTSAGLLLSVWQQNQDDSKDVDYDPTRTELVAREAVVRFAVEHEAMYGAAARAIDRGDITTDTQLIEWLETNRETAKEEAFKEFNAMFHDDLPRDKQDNPGALDRQRASTFMESAARGFGSIE
jgi:hypothetical protein